jgi:uncharacterized protein YjbI with pentapeptide repeats
MRAKRYKSEELLRLYQAGQRNFRKAHIWDQSFKGQDLSGIDFEGADIQGSDFTNTILRGANFRSVMGGVKWGTILRMTSFRNADLTDADCTLAQFERTDFNGAIFNCECWLQGQKGGHVRHPSFRQSKPKHGRPEWQGGIVSPMGILVFLLLGANFWFLAIFGFLYREYITDKEISLILLFCFGVGLCNFWQAWRINQRNQALNRHGQITPGVITDLWFKWDDENFQGLYFVAYQFAEGFQAYQVFRSAFGLASEGLLPTSLDMGDRVTVCYVPTKPKFCRLEAWK